MQIGVWETYSEKERRLRVSPNAGTELRDDQGRAWIGGTVAVRPASSNEWLGRGCTLYSEGGEGGGHGLAPDGYNVSQVRADPAIASIGPQQGQIPSNEAVEDPDMQSVAGHSPVTALRISMAHRRAMSGRSTRPAGRSCKKYQAESPDSRVPEAE